MKRVSKVLTALVLGTVLAGLAAGCGGGVIIGGAFSGLVESLTNNLMSLGKKKEEPKETVQAEATAAAEA